jgi:hypothetical protein
LDNPTDPLKTERTFAYLGARCEDSILKLLQCSYSKGFRELKTQKEVLDEFLPNNCAAEWERYNNCEEIAFVETQKRKKELPRQREEVLDACRNLPPHYKNYESLSEEEQRMETKKCLGRLSSYYNELFPTSKYPSTEAAKGIDEWYEIFAEHRRKTGFKCC